MKVDEVHPFFSPGPAGSLYAAHLEHGSKSGVRQRIEDLCVATGLTGTHCHRNHRDPGTHPVAPAQTAPGPAPTGGVGWARSAAAG